MTKLFALKGRALAKAIPLIAADVGQVRAWTTLTPLAERLAAAFWPGPLTLVLRAAVSDGRAACWPRAGRWPSACRIRPSRAALAAAAECPVTSTSANPSGEPPTADPDEVARALPAVDVLIDGGLTPGGPPRRSSDATGSRRYSIRAGAIAWERVLESLGPASTPAVS